MAPDLQLGLLQPSSDSMSFAWQPVPSFWPPYYGPSLTRLDTSDGNFLAIFGGQSLEDRSNGVRQLSYSNMLRFIDVSRPSRPLRLAEANKPAARGAMGMWLVQPNALRRRPMLVIFGGKKKVDSPSTAGEDHIMACCLQDWASDQTCIMMCG